MANDAPPLTWFNVLNFIIPIFQAKKAPSPFLSGAVNEVVQTALDSEYENDQENNLIIGYLSAHLIFF